MMPHIHANCVGPSGTHTSGSVAMLMLAVTLLVVGCAGDARDAEAARAALASSDGGPGTPSGTCSLFTRAEIASMLGEPVGEGYVAGPMNTACQWDGTRTDDAYAHVQVVPAEYWSKPHGAAGYEPLTGMGREAYVVPELGGWGAGALRDTLVVGVAVKSGTSSRDTAVRLLRESIARLERR